MTVSNARIRPARVAAAVALSFASALALSACGAGQIAQTATQVAAINGNNVDQGTISLRNVHIGYPDSDEFVLEEGGRAELLFTAINEDQVTPDRLTGIETEAATEVVFEGTAAASGVEIPALTSLTGGLPVGSIAEPDADSAYVEVVLEGLSDDVRPGLTVPMTFTFENAGDVVVDVPVDAGPVTERVSDEISGASEE